MRLVDCHAHVFARAWPCAAAARYRPDYEASFADWAALHARHGISHGVLVQPSFYGTDNRALEAALAAADATAGRVRGVAVIDDSFTAAVLDRLDSAGVRAIRFNLVRSARIDWATPAWRRIFAWMAARHWHVEMQVDGAALADALDSLLGATADSALAIVVDHFGRPEPSAGARSAGFDALCRRAVTGRVYAKLSAPYRCGEAAPVDDCAAALLHAFGAGRLLWGSDWPHTGFEAQVDFAGLVDALARWIPDPSARARVAWDNPAALYGFVQIE